MIVLKNTNEPDLWHGDNGPGLSLVLTQCEVRAGSARPLLYRTDVRVAIFFIYFSYIQELSVFTKMLNNSIDVVPKCSYSTFCSLPYLHLNLSSTLSFHSNDPDRVGGVHLQRRLYFINQEAIFVSKVALSLVTFSFTFCRETDRSCVDDIYRRSSSRQYKQSVVS